MGEGSSILSDFTRQLSPEIKGNPSPCKDTLEPTTKQLTPYL